MMSALWFLMSTIVFRRHGAGLGNAAADSVTSWVAFLFSCVWELGWNDALCGGTPGIACCCMIVLRTEQLSVCRRSSGGDMGEP